LPRILPCGNLFLGGVTSFSFFSGSADFDVSSLFSVVGSVGVDVLGLFLSEVSI